MKRINLMVFLMTIMILVLNACDAFNYDVTPPPLAASVNPTLSAQGVRDKDKMGLNNLDKEGMIVHLQVDGVIKNVANKPLPENLIVTLNGYYQGREVYSKTTTCNQTDLSFSFKDVVSHIGWYFFTSIRLDNLDYYSEVVQVQPLDTRLVLPIPIYEVSDDLSFLEIDKLYILMSIDKPGMVQVMQMINVSNKSSKIIASKDPIQNGVLPFYLPKQATQVEFIEGNVGKRYIKTDFGFVDTVPISPGQNTYQNMLAFTIPYKQKLEYTQFLPLKTREIMVFVPLEYEKQTIKVKADHLNFYGKQTIDGIEYQIFKGEEIKPQEKLQLVLIFSPLSYSLKEWIASLVIQTKIDYRLLIGLFFFGLALVIGGLWILKYEKRKNNSHEFFDYNERFNDPETVIEAIIALDDGYKEGKLSEDVYQDRRSKLKRLLAKQIENT